MAAYGNSKRKLKQYDLMLAGAASGFITRGICQPLDVLKIRFQLQVEPITKVQTSKYHSIIHASSLIYREEGVRALWKGHVPAQLLSITYGLVQFWSFETLLNQSKLLNLDLRYKPFVTFACGALAGCSATFASFPFDVVRTRLVGQSEKNKIFAGVTDAFLHIVKKEGFFVLYRGMLPTFIQVGPQVGVQFMCYKFFDGMYRSLVHMDQYSYTLPGSLISGSLSGLVAKTVIYPLDLVKKRMQIQGMFNCVKKILIVEGPLGLFKGLHPSLWKAVITTALHFTSYEFMIKIISDIRS
ncbi:hypothetical protein FQR65_LT05774 [Abscondita terminalis]|nr:hypothetical protein FQR65_LT05774 [Abscondita terminalis]